MEFLKGFLSRMMDIGNARGVGTGRRVIGGLRMRRNRKDEHDGGCGR